MNLTWWAMGTCAVCLCGASCSVCDSLALNSCLPCQSHHRMSNRTQNSCHSVSFLATSCSYPIGCPMMRLLSCSSSSWLVWSRPQVMKAWSFRSSLAGAEIGDAPLIPDRNVLFTFVYASIQSLCQ